MDGGNAALISDAFGGTYSFAAQYMTLGLPPEVVARLQGDRSYDDLADSKLYTSYRHEFQHYVQNLTTSYGLWKTLVLRIAGSLIHAGEDFAREDAIPLHLPYDDHMSRRHGSLSDLPRHEFAFGTAKMLVSGIKLLEGDHKVPENQRFEHIAVPRKSTQFHSQSDGVSVAMSAATLLEYQAYTQQLIGLWNTGGIAEEHAELLGSRIAQYPAFRQTQNVVAWGFRGNVENRMALNYLTFELATLALSPRFPAPALFALMMGRHHEEDRIELAWEDFHPGWRLQRLAATIRRKKLSFPPVDGFPAFVEQVREILDWPDGATARNAILSEYETEGLKPFVDDLLACREEVDAVIEQCAGFSADFLDNCLKIQPLRALLRGPNPRYADVNLSSAGWELALNRYFGGSSVCPVCFSRSHRPDCILKKG
jgi:hypothetical protein